MFALGIPVLLLRILWRGRKDRAQWRNWYERLGIYRRPLKLERPVWVHAVSVGESMAAVPLIRALRERFGAIDIVVTTTTATGAQTVSRTLGESVTHLYFPYDLPLILRRFMDHVQPRLLIVMETELWPNTIEMCARRGIPVILTNARLSRRSFAAYQRLAALSRHMLDQINLIGAQSVPDATRFCELGARQARVHVTGSLKFDVDLPASLYEQAESLRRSLGVNRPVMMFGSTREGEEALLFKALSRLKEAFPTLLAIVAPRHPERFVEVSQAASAAGFRVVEHSSRAACHEDTDVYLLDVMGELPSFYAAADLAFVGGSLLPFGGHNVLEPAGLGTPVLTGPHTHNFAGICQLLADGGALVVVQDADALVSAATVWLGDSNERDQAGQRGRDLVRQHRGATRQTLALLEQFVDVA